MSLSSYDTIQKHYMHNNQDEDNSLNCVNNIKNNFSSQKFWQIDIYYLISTVINIIYILITT